MNQLNKKEKKNNNTTTQCGTARHGKIETLPSWDPLNANFRSFRTAGEGKKATLKTICCFVLEYSLPAFFFFGYNKLTLSIVVVQDGLPSSVWNVVGYTQQNKTNKEKRMASSHGSSCQNIAMRIANRSLTSRPASPEGQPKRERETERDEK